MHISAEYGDNLYLNRRYVHNSIERLQLHVCSDSMIAPAAMFVTTMCVHVSTSYVRPMPYACESYRLTERLRAANVCRYFSPVDFWT